MASSRSAGPPAVLDWVPPEADHRDVERVLLARGWSRCGAGDWAVALQAPDGAAAARVSPFDPTGPFTAALYREAAPTRQVPVLFAHRRLAGGGDLQVMERLEPVGQQEAAVFLQAVTRGDPDVAALADAVHRVHARARRELPWCGPLDSNPANVMRAADGRLVVLDLFYADGPALYATALADPDRVATLIPEAERRFMADIPLAGSGPWDEASRGALREGMARADARTARSRRP